MPYYYALAICIVSNIITAILVDVSMRRNVPKIGELVVDFSDPDGPFMFLRLRDSLSKLKDKAEVRITIVEEVISRK